jgi:hypothetical protein
MEVGVTATAGVEPSSKLRIIPGAQFWYMQRPPSGGHLLEFKLPAGRQALQKHAKFELSNRLLSLPGSIWEVVRKSDRLKPVLLQAQLRFAYNSMSFFVP